MSDVDKKFVQLSDGTKMPSIGLGTLQGTPEEMDMALRTAIEEAGYRHIDTAFMYDNEKAIGDALKGLMDTGKVKREELFIVTKLPIYAMRPSDVEPFLLKSLEYLQLRYVDLYLVHLPCGATNYGFDYNFLRDNGGRVPIDPTTDHVAIWKKMEEMVDKGLTKSIGVSNFNIRQIQRVLDNARIKPSNLQVECHAYLQQDELADFCRKNGITFTAYSPLGSPAFRTLIEQLSGEVIDGPPLLEDPLLTAIAKQHKKSVAQVLLRWLVQRGMIVIPKSTTPKRIKENIDIWDFNLSEDDVKTIGGLDRNMRIFTMKSFSGFEDHPEYPF